MGVASGQASRQVGEAAIYSIIGNEGSRGLRTMLSRQRGLRLSVRQTSSTGEIPESFRDFHCNWFIAHRPLNILRKVILGEVVSSGGHQAFRQTTTILGTEFTRLLMLSTR